MRKEKRKKKQAIHKIQKLPNKVFSCRFTSRMAVHPKRVEKDPELPVIMSHAASRLSLLCKCQDERSKDVEKGKDAWSIECKVNPNFSKGPSYTSNSVTCGVEFLLPSLLTLLTALCLSFFFCKPMSFCPAQKMMQSEMKKKPKKKCSKVIKKS